MSVVGTIVVAEGQITVRVEEPNGHIETDYSQVTIENVRDAARLLSVWMDIPYEDVALECQRIHGNDQWLASLRETINDTAGRERRAG